MDVVERALQARKEAGPCGFELGLRQRRASGEQPMVRPSIIVGERTIGLHKSCRQTRSPSDKCFCSFQVGYSAASLAARLRFGFRAFASTGARNFPV